MAMMKGEGGLRRGVAGAAAVRDSCATASVGQRAPCLPPSSSMTQFFLERRSGGGDRAGSPLRAVVVGRRPPSCVRACSDA